MFYLLVVLAVLSSVMRPRRFVRRFRRHLFRGLWLIPFMGWAMGRDWRRRPFMDRGFTDMGYGMHCGPMHDDGPMHGHRHF